MLLPRKSKPPQAKTAWACIRQSDDSVESWIDTTTISLISPHHARSLGEADNATIHGWGEHNPILRVEQITIALAVLAMPVPGGVHATTP